MRRFGTALSFGLAALLLGGCVTSWRSDYLAPRDRQPATAPGHGGLNLSPSLEERILALNAENLSPTAVREVLAQAPAPRIVNLHGGIPTVVKYMISFSKFLEGMGYPEASLRNPRDGTYSFTSYKSSQKLAGVVAWYYEQEGLRPMIVGHSHGGFQTIRVLYQLAGHLAEDIRVYSPLTGRAEARSEIVDPISGEPRPVTEVSLCYAAAVGAGGIARLLPPNWTLTGKLRTVPDSVDAFTSYYMGLDLIGGDCMGFGPANHFQASGQTVIRNVRLPTGSQHKMLPNTKHLLKDPQIVDWIEAYTPTNRPSLNVDFTSRSTHILFAADIWHDIRKHWVLELQRVIRSERARHHEL